MAATSIHIRPVARGSEAHNERKKELPHIRKELTPLNESWKDASFHSIDEEMDVIRADYKAAHGKKLHAKATPIREAVVVIRQDTTIDELDEACRICQERWGIRAMQIHTHKDEGHGEGDTWKPNLHAHIVFCWYDFEKHTTCKLGKQDTSEMQTVFARVLGMQRGQSSDKKWLNALQYKNKQEGEKLHQKVKEEIDDALAIEESARNLIDQVNILAGQKNSQRVSLKSDEVERVERLKKIMKERPRTMEITKVRSYKRLLTKAMLKVVEVIVSLTLRLSQHSSAKDNANANERMERGEFRTRLGLRPIK